jgi:hypothetical protein
MASGILGLALIQAPLAGLGLIAGVPAAGLLYPGLRRFGCDPGGRSDRVDLFGEWRKSYSLCDHQIVEQAEYGGSHPAEQEAADDSFHKISSRTHRRG